MSRFFRQGDDSSSEESSEEEYISEEEEEEEEKSGEEESEDGSDEDESSDSDSDDEGVKKTGASRFLRDDNESDSEDSDDGGNKILKSAADKQVSELESTIDAIEKKQKISDWAAVSTGESGLHFAHCFITILLTNHDFTL